MYSIYTCEQAHYNPPETASDRCVECKKPVFEHRIALDTVSNSFLDDIQRCDRYAYYTRRLYLESKYARSIALDAGSLWHVAMRMWHGTKADPSTRLRLAKEAVATEVNNYPDFPFFPEGKECRSVDHLLTTLDLYTEYYGDNRDLDVTIIGGAKLQETSFKILLSENLTFNGYLDAIANIRGIPNPVVIEFKTTSMMTEAIKNNYKISHQLTGYIHAAQELINPSISRAVVDLIGWVKNINPNIHFQRIHVSKSREQIQSWKEQTVRKFEAYKRQIQSNVHDQRTTSCIMFNRICDFAEPCLSHGNSIMENGLLRAGYRVRKFRHEIIEDELE